MTTPRKRQVKGSDRAYSITLTLKVSEVQHELIQSVKPASQSIGEWLRLAAVSAAYHERRRLTLESTSAGCTIQDLTCDPNG